MYGQQTHEIKNYYLSESENFKIYMLKIFILVSLTAIVLDFWLSNNIEYMAFFGLETIVFVVLSIVYLLFPRFLSLDTAIYFAIVAVTLLIILSLNMIGLNKYFVLFSLAVVPIYSFFFFGAYLGLIWSLSVIFFLTLSMVIAMLDKSNTFFNAETIAQISIAYISLTYLYYRMELRRSSHEQALSALLDKKTMLLKEVHHRSKNNLQTVMGLLESQALRVENEECKKVLTSQRLRLKTMSMVHESLSGNSNYEKIEMSAYLDSIVRYIASVFGHQIIVDFDEIYLSMEDAMNIGLFFNEALSNAAEHAYSPYKEGKIEVSLKGTESTFEVSIRDYGKGFDAHKKRKSLGLILMEDICQFFKNSILSIENNNGTQIKAKFNM
jgi:two-component sensor histidine kinase